MNGVDAAGLPSGYGLYLFQTLLALGAVCLLAYVVLRYGVKRLYGGGRQGQHLRVIERLALDPRRSIYLVEVAGRQVLLGTGESGVRFLTEVDRGEEPIESEEVPEEEARSESRADQSPDPG